MIDLPKGVKVAALSEAKLRSIHERLLSNPRIFSDDCRDFNAFASMWLSPAYVILEVGAEEGYISFDDIRHGLRCGMHAFFFGKGLSRWADLVKDCIMWGFFQFGLVRMEVFVPEGAHAVRRFIERRIGARREGCLRKRELYDKMPTDIHVYGLLREEVLR